MRAPRTESDRGRGGDRQRQQEAEPLQPRAWLGRVEAVECELDRLGAGQRHSSHAQREGSRAGGRSQIAERMHRDATGLEDGVTRSEASRGGQTTGADLRDDEPMDCRARLRGIERQRSRRSGALVPRAHARARYLETTTRRDPGECRTER